jgi:sulfatase maturation enzyme AslB (radical SAM superfamily)
MATNGLLALDRLDWVAANLDDLAVSFDGLPQVHDANRRLPDGGPTSQHVLRTLRLLDERGYAYGVRATLMADHIASLPDSMEYLFTACHPSVVQVEPVYRFGRAQGAASVETDEFIDAFRLARERVRKLGGNLVFSPVRIGALTASVWRPAAT